MGFDMEDCFDDADGPPPLTPESLWVRMNRIVIAVAPICIRFIAIQTDTGPCYHALPAKYLKTGEPIRRLPYVE